MLARPTADEGNLGPRDPDHVQHALAHLRHPNTDPSGIRAKPIRSQAPCCRCATVQVPCRIPGTHPFVALANRETREFGNTDELETQEMMNFWKQSTHVMAYFKNENFRDHKRRPTSFMDGFLEVR